MFSEILNTDSSKERMTDLLEKMGLSKEAIEILVPFMIHLGLVNVGLLEKKIGADIARQVYDLSMLGFLAAHPKVQDELDELMKDEKKRTHAIEVVLQAVLARMKDKGLEGEPTATSESNTKATLH